MRTATSQAAALPDTAKKKSRRFVRFWDLYLMLIPALLFLLVFKYAPMYGVVIAFKDFNIIQGVMKSPWVGLQHFRELFTFSEFPQVVRNTLIISLMKLIVGFPAPIIMALLLNELRLALFKRTVQTITYLPHFISWVVVGGITVDLLSPNSGIVNKIMMSFGMEPVFFMTDERLFRWILVFTDIWKEAGWGAIIYLAALLGINEELFQAATVDGAGRMKQIWHISLPGIRSTIIVLLLLRLGHVLDVGFEQVLAMYNPTVYSVADIIDTYVFRVGLGTMQFGLTTAAGLFKSVIGCLLLVTANFIARKMGEDGVY
ncbi:putative aldouronate transport system permease protein [Paenibacillus sp. UNCCL117]|uniref:ABC transporter permease n=1 Tax=unclassified Paenibacillus TaxID=185978 RepID=UPI0008881760|nr:MULTISPECIES: ABC transporter permease subunit [unclassified Paenibacillus]SDC48687.1 putative aldouronate transport system permease protein [Paenibacillus sp. cl123]SFW11896.1 putative aldouronate transport system permease protein [Paenibacillus sp. UNCCL117]